MDAAELAAVTERGTLADGTPWPVPVTLDMPAGAAPADAGHLVLQDPEGSPLAVLSVTERQALLAPGGATPPHPPEPAARFGPHWCPCGQPTVTTRADPGTRPGAGTTGRSE